MPQDRLLEHSRKSRLTPSVQARRNHAVVGCRLRGDNLAVGRAARLNGVVSSLCPQEIYLLERYGSAAYFEEMRDAWEKMLDVAERALQLFMLNLPPDYRSRHASQQPDLVWGRTRLTEFPRRP